MKADPGELELILAQLIDEHRALLGQMDAQHAAMKALDTARMEEAARRQEAARMRIAGLEARRRGVVGQLVRRHAGGAVTLAHVAELYPARREALLGLREGLKAAAQEVVEKGEMAGRLAGAMVGHLNTVVGLLAGAVERSGVYTKNGAPRVAGRIGAIEAVG
jgi:hypothetical protein